VIIVVYPPWGPRNFQVSRSFGFVEREVFFAHWPFDISCARQREMLSVLFDGKQQLLRELAKMCLAFVQLVTSSLFGHAC
jgi:hypothetical protein